MMLSRCEGVGMCEGSFVGIMEVKKKQRARYTLLYTPNSLHDSSTVIKQAKQVLSMDTAPQLVKDVEILPG
jgi:hypothetical protein